MSSIKTLIVDDEEPAQLRLRRLLDQEPDIEVMGVCSDGGEAVRFIREHEPELVFLDIHMQALNGLEVIGRLEGQVSTVVIFVTAYDQYALQAFETNALDYLLKPFTGERLRQALERARARIHEQKLSEYSDRLMSVLQEYEHAMSKAEGEHHGARRASPRRLALKEGSRMVFLDPDEVDWIESEGVYVRVRAGTDSYLLRESLSNVERRLDSQQFVRIHRSTVVNIDRITEVVPHIHGGAIVRLNDGTELKLSRGYRDRLNATLG